MFIMFMIIEFELDMVNSLIIMLMNDVMILFDVLVEDNITLSLFILINQIIIIVLKIIFIMIVIKKTIVCVIISIIIFKMVRNVNVI